MLSTSEWWQRFGPDFNSHSPRRNDYKGPKDLPRPTRFTGRPIQTGWKAHRFNRQNQSVDNLKIIAWDGEGWGDEIHKYVLLANSEGAEIVDTNGLPTLDILTMLWNTNLVSKTRQEYPLHVMYYAEYDWNNWLKDLDYDSACAIAANYPVRVGPYTVRYNEMWFEIIVGKDMMRVWDIAKYWQKSFVGALRASFPDYDQLEMIESWKGVRGEFTEEMLPDISKYNAAELIGLVEITRQLFRDLETAGINRPPMLTGAGSLAGSLLKQHKIKKYMTPWPEWPEEVKEPVLCAYAGGRIEPLKVGHHHDTFYTSDIRSAYPNAIRMLPCMAHGTWRKATEFDPSQSMSVWFIEWDYSDYAQGEHANRDYPTDCFYPFFYRIKGTITYPPAGRGWQWWPEVITAIEKGWHVRVIEGWIWEQECGHKPFEWVPRLYQHRANLREAGKVAASQELKLALNSLYGKLIQSKGSTKERTAPFFNPAWAGWVTSFTRAYLLLIAHQDPDAIVYMMTDSLGSIRPLTVAEGTWLGEWESEQYDSAVVIQAGFGWLFKDGEVYTAKSRGFLPNSITPEMVDVLWRHNFYSNEWNNEIAIEQRNPVKLGTAVINEDTFKRWNGWFTTYKKLNVYGGDETKRMLLGDRPPNLADRMADLIPRSPVKIARAWNAGLEAMDAVLTREGLRTYSEPYKPKWRDYDTDALPEVIGTLRDSQTVLEGIYDGDHGNASEAAEVVKTLG